MENGKAMYLTFDPRVSAEMFRIGLFLEINANFLNLSLQKS
jgi:hypothetical protein